MNIDDRKSTVRSRTTQRKPFCVIASFLLIPFVPGCYTEFVEEEVPDAAVSQEVDNTPRFMYFPQDRLVPIPGWDEIAGIVRAPVIQDAAPTADETATQPQIPESWSIVYLPAVNQPVVSSDQSDQENETVAVSRATDNSQPPSSVTRTMITAPVNDVRRTSGVERSTSATSRSADQNNSRNTGAARSGGR